MEPMVKRVRRRSWRPFIGQPCTPARPSNGREAQRGFNAFAKEGYGVMPQSLRAAYTGCSETSTLVTCLSRAASMASKPTP